MDYMPEEEWDLDDDSLKTRLESTKILWPSSTHMKDIYSHVALVPEWSGHPNEEEPTVFFLPKTFALMEPDVHCQMFHYTCHTSLYRNHSRTLRVPHNKSYFRLNTAKAHDECCTCASVFWFLMTSACLSKGLRCQCNSFIIQPPGAQGEYHGSQLCDTCGHLRQVSFWLFELIVS